MATTDSRSAHKVIAPGQMRLARLQVFNWGTFEGLHDIAVPRAGLLLTGESGSGKSSLLDAMSAVLMKPGETRFNAAAQDGPAGDRDRSVLSYVRGAYRQESSDESGEIRPGYLRTSATRAGIALTFEDGTGKVFTGMRLFHMPRGGRSAQDLATSFLAFDRAVELREALEFVRTGMDRRRLKRELNPLTVAANYTDFGVYLLRHTGMGNTQAQRLLHRTQAAKNLTSLDGLLRDFMLDIPDTFDIARTAVEQFTQLREAHAAVVDAREQVEALSPLRTEWKNREEALARREEQRILDEGLDTFHEKVTAQVAREERDKAEVSLAKARTREARARDAVEHARDKEQAARRTLDGAGGDRREILQAKVNEALTHLTYVTERAAEARSAFATVGGPFPATAEELLRAVQLAEREQQELEKANEAWSTHAGTIQRDIQAAKEEYEELREEILSLGRRSSNLPARLVNAREDIAAAVGVPGSALPFAGELMDVTDPEWRGAVERLLGRFARTIVVPEQLYRPVAAVVDGRHWGERIDYEREREVRPAERRKADGSTVLDVLRLKAGPHRDWLAGTLAERFSHTLVEDARDLPAHEKALTRAGQVRNRDTHTKNDRSRINDAAQWVIGTSNTERVEALRVRVQEVEKRRADLDAQWAAHQAAQSDSRKKENALERIRALTWENIDEAYANEQVNDRYRDLKDLAEKLGFDELEARVTQLANETSRAQEERAAAQAAVMKLEEEVKDATAAFNEASAKLADLPPLSPGTEDTLQTMAHEHVRRLTRVSVGQAVSKIRQTISQALRSADHQISQAEGQLGMLRARYLDRWASDAANLVDSLDGTEDFVRRLERLERDRLPEFEQRFLTLLHEQSQSNIGQLSASIKNAIRDVRQRLAPVNESLARAQFDRERNHFLTLEAMPALNGEARDFLDDLRSITEGAFNPQGETPAQAEQRFVRMNKLLTRLGSEDRADVSWRLRVLDTRKHVTFVAHELDASGTRVDTYEGSGGRSGGQRQRLVTFCLAAALRYQLTESATGYPPYGLVVLDEAFDKTDINFTRAGLEVFRSFGFQLLLATPMRLLQTIEEFVGGVAKVSNTSGKASTVQVGQYEVITPGTAPEPAQGSPKPPSPKPPSPKPPSPKPPSLPNETDATDSETLF